jgi:hypothetical protein
MLAKSNAGVLKFGAQSQPEICAIAFLLLSGFGTV